MATAYRERDNDSLWRVLKALGSPVRLQIVHFVQRHPRCICNDILLHLPDDCSRAQSTLSQHLKILRDANIIEAECDGSATCYVVNQARLDWVQEQIGHLHD
jgi:DNA-binding transcriptional ArsR family regulator